MAVLWIFFLLLGIAALAGFAGGEITYRKRLRQRVLDQFGRCSQEDSPLDQVLVYAALDPSAQVDSTTWADLDMDRVFQRINSCQSAVGEQVLYRQLHQLSLADDWESLLTHLEQYPKERERLWILLAQFGKRNSHYTLSRFLSSPVEVPLHCGRMLSLFTVMPLVGFLIMVWNIWVGGCIVLGSLCFNIVLYYLGKRNIQGDLESLRSFSSLLWTAGKMSGVLTFVPWKKELEAFLKPFQGLRTGLVGLAPKGSSDWDLLQEYVHVFTLRDLRLYRRAMKKIKKYNREAIQLFSKVGLVDAAIAVLSFRVGISQWCQPQFSQENTLKFKGLFHPLLSHPVANDGSLKKDVLLTGSNASGKSTFLKALAVNAILGQSVATCSAASYSFRKGPVLTSMAVRDDITAGESYFLAEVRSLKRLVDASRAGGCLLFIDEILKGTNTTERLAASQAVLESLHRRDCFCVAATHDLELTRRLEGSYFSYHFQEQLTGDGVVFDYKLRPGPAQTRNAIRLLDALGFPGDMVRRAEELAEKGDNPP